MDKNIKNGIIYTVIVLSVIVLAIQSIPFFLNAEQFKSNIYEGFENSTDLKLDFKNIKLSGEPFLRAKITFDEPIIRNKKNDVIFYAENASASVDIIPLLLKKIHIANVKLNSSDVFVTRDKSGKFNFERTSPPPDPLQTSDFVLETDGMDILAKDYQIEFLDKTTPKPVDTKAKGKKLEINAVNSDFGTKVETIGALATNNKRAINYNIKTKIFFPDFSEYLEEHPLTKTEESSRINPLYEIAQNGLKADLFADLEIKTPEDINGEINFDKLSINLNGRRLPDSHIHIIAQKDTFLTNANILIAPDAIVKLNGDFKKDFFNLNLKTSHMQLSELKVFCDAIFSILGKPVVELKKLDIQGVLLADLHLKSDLKTVKSSGYLKIKNANVNYKSGTLKIKSLNSNIKLSNNNIAIQDTTGIIDNNKFEVKGNINKNADTKLKFIIPSINIKTLTGSKFWQEKFSNVSKIDGKIAATIDVSGKLKELKYNGDLNLKQMTLYFKNSPAKFSFPTGKIALNKQKATVDIPKLNINNSNFALQGDVPFESTEGGSDFLAYGRMKAADVAKIINTDAVGHGEVPTICKINAKKGNMTLQLQFLNDSRNNILIQGMNTNNLLNANINIQGKVTKLNDVGLFKTNRKFLTGDLNSNLAGTNQIATASGIIRTLGSQKVFEGVRIKVLTPTKVILPFGKNITTEVVGDTTLSGTTKNPIWNGYFTLFNTHIPDMQAKITKSNVTIQNKKIAANMYGVSSGKTNFDAQTTMDMKELDPAVIDSLNIDANYFNANDFFSQVAKIAPPRAPRKIEYSLNHNNELHLSPVVIKSGKFSAKKFVINDVPCYNLTSNLKLDRYNVLKMSNINTATMNGTIHGEITHDGETAMTFLNLKARGINVRLFGEKFLSMPEGEMSGIGASNMKLYFYGSTPDEIQNSLTGALNFKVQNGEMGNLGRIDFYLRAANILSNNILTLNLNRVLNGVRLKRTGEFDQAYGHLTFIKGGIVRIDTLKTVGPRLSILMKGYINNNTQVGSLSVYGRLSEEVVGILGPIGDFSIEKALEKVPVLNGITKYSIGLVESNVPDLIRDDIPPLSINGATSQEFTARVLGNINKTSSVKSFRWIRDNAGTAQ